MKAHKFKKAVTRKKSKSFTTRKQIKTYLERVCRKFSTDMPQSDYSYSFCIDCDVSQEELNNMQREFETLWDNIENPLTSLYYRYGCLRDDIEDLVQETAVRIWQNFDIVSLDISFITEIVHSIHNEYRMKRMEKDDLEIPMQFYVPYPCRT